MSTAYIRTLASLTLAAVLFAGRLVDQTTGQPLVKVFVHASGPVSENATTNSAGRFWFRDLKPGDYTITVQSNDVPEQTFHISASVGRPTLQTIKACSTTLDYHCAMPGGGG